MLIFISFFSICVVVLTLGFGNITPLLKEELTLSYRCHKISQNSLVLKSDWGHPFMRNENEEVTCSLDVCIAECCLCEGQRQCGTIAQEIGHSRDSQLSYRLLPSFHRAHPPPAGTHQAIIFDIHPAKFSLY